MSQSRPIQIDDAALRWLGHLFFAVYCAVAIVYYRERVLYDTSVFLNTGILYDGSFFRALARLPVQIPPQILPMMAAKLGAPTYAIAMVYSLSFALFHYCFWLVVAHGFRRADLGAAFILCVLVHLVHNNIFIQSDLMHAAGYMFVFLAAAEAPRGDTPRQRLFRFASLQVVILAACFSHPLMAALTLYFAAYATLVQRRIDKHLVASLGVALGLYALNKYSFMDNYEAFAFGRTVGLFNFQDTLGALPNYLWHAHRLGIAVFFVFLLTVAGNRRNVLPVILTFAALFGLGIAICSWIPLTQHHNWQFSGYTWMYFLPFYFVLIVPVYDRHTAPSEVRSLRRRRTTQSLLCAVAFVWAICGTVLDFHLSRERQLFITRIRDSLADTKPPIYLLDGRFSSNPLLRENDLTLWDDSLLISSYDGPHNACMIIPPYSWNGGSPDEYRYHYLTPLNRRYFDLPSASRQTASPVNVAVDRAALDAAALDIELEFPEQPTHLSYIGGPPEDYRRPLEIVYALPLRIVNHGGKPFPSRLQPNDPEHEPAIPVTVGYRWTADGRIIAEDRRAETLPIDVPHSLVHNIHVRRSGIPANATLAVGLFVDKNFLPCANVQTWP